MPTGKTWLIIRCLFMECTLFARRREGAPQNQMRVKGHSAVVSFHRSKGTRPLRDEPRSQYPRWLDYASMLFAAPVVCDAYEQGLLRMPYQPMQIVPLLDLLNGALWRDRTTSRHPELRRVLTNCSATS